jgi:hypothetical protein
MNWAALIGILTGWAGLVLAYWRWQAQRLRRQNERIKSILLGVHFLMQKSSDKPDEYVITRLRDALKEED